MGEVGEAGACQINRRDDYCLLTLCVWNTPISQHFSEEDSIPLRFTFVLATAIGLSEGSAKAEYSVVKVQPDHVFVEHAPISDNPTDPVEICQMGCINTCTSCAQRAGVNSAELYKCEIEKVKCTLECSTRE